MTLFLVFSCYKEQTILLLYKYGKPCESIKQYNCDKLLSQHDIIEIAINNHCKFLVEGYKGGDFFKDNDGKINDTKLCSCDVCETFLEKQKIFCGLIDTYHLGFSHQN